MNRFDHITQGPFSVRITKAGQDITAIAGVREVHYKADGTGTRTLADGSVLQGEWRFVDEAQTVVETKMAGKTSRFRILDLTATVYRKVDVDTGVEIEHTPLPQ